MPYIPATRGYIFYNKIHKNWWLYLRVLDLLFSLSKIERINLSEYQPQSLSNIIIL